ncbi:MAG: hypothetical protein K8823_1682 [Cenarchaeum symbiont of Oopsacas minuta]|nr:hypothetical protein [Cenarchaeum symbiont of Oopsacas minuta]MDI1496366.1 hypothetical protein [Cenarchaeum symbiont of Oopsacas minuta]
MDKKIKVAFIYKSNYKFLTGEYFDKSLHYFFMYALKRNKRIIVSYFPCKDIFDVSKVSNFDIILLSSDGLEGTPNLIGIKECTLPVICRIGDPHSAEKLKRFQYQEKWNIDCCFGIVHPNKFYEYYPKKCNYKTILVGVEPNEYVNPTPFEHRFKEKILLTGLTGRPTLTARLVNKVFKSLYSGWYFYNLRSKCRLLPYVFHNTMIDNGYKLLADTYPKTLFKFRASIAASTPLPTIKYWEIPAAGCLTFMEMTKQNMADFLGFKDGENSVYINNKNYKKKFMEYLSDVDNPKWKEIADNGREYVMKNINNDIAVDSLVDLMEEYLK